MTSHRQIFRSSAILGGASAISMLVGIVKMKWLAILLGPAGVGLVGLYLNIMSIASTLSSCGIGESAVRQLAASTEEARTLAIVRRALWLSNVILGLTGMIALWLVREQVSLWVFGDIEHASEIGWLGLGVLLTLISGSQTTLLQGLRRIGDLSFVKIIGSVFGAVVGILLIYWLGENGVLWFVLTTPLAGIPVAAYYAGRLPKVKVAHHWGALSEQWRVMLKMGIPLMATGLLTLGTQLSARSLILHNLSMDASGYFQAAWSISMTYVGFMMSAMGSDYYPRLTAIIGDRSLARRMANEQIEMALLLAGPILLGMLTFAPWVVHILYAPEFAPAADVLRWQILGDFLKVASWPTGLILLAQGRSGFYFFTQVIWAATYLAAIHLGMQEQGLVMAGVGFWLAYMVLYGMNAVVAFVAIGYKSTLRNWLTIFLLELAGGLIIFLSVGDPCLSYTVEVGILLVVSVYSIGRLDHLVNLRELVKRKRRVREK